MHCSVVIIIITTVSSCFVCLKNIDIPVYSRNTARFAVCYSVSCAFLSSIFQRISVLKKSEDDLRKYFKYELSPYPLSLFEESQIMLKTPKSKLYDIMKPTTRILVPENNTCIIDGGYLLHRVVWNASSTFLELCTKYVQYIQRHYGNDCTVVFDGYDDEGNCTKKCERIRRSKLSHSVDVFFDEKTPVTVKQNSFLANSGNKSRFIVLLKSKLEDAGIHTILSKGDADRNIVQAAIKEYTNSHSNGKTSSV